MPEVITDWMSAIGNLASGLGVLAGVLLTARQFEIWRKQALVQKKAALAEDILSSAYEVNDVLECVRSSFESLPQEELSNKYYTLNAKMKRLQENRACFDNLRRHQVRAKFLIGDDAVDNSIQELFKARQSVWAALATLGAFVDDPPRDEDNRKLAVELRSQIYAKYTERDKLSKEINEALDCLKEKLGPYVRMGSKVA
jgi:hypothetical protein